jgi:hypothetical protein
MLKSELVSTSLREIREKLLVSGFAVYIQVKRLIAT